MKKDAPISLEDLSKYVGLGMDGLEALLESVGLTVDGLLNQYGLADTITVSITRKGVTTLLSSCRLDTPEDMVKQGLLAPWIEPDAQGFGTLSESERVQVRRLTEATVRYCDDGVGTEADPLA